MESPYTDNGSGALDVAAWRLAAAMEPALEEKAHIERYRAFTTATEADVTRVVAAVLAGFLPGAS